MCQTPNADAVDWQTGKTPLECTKHILENEHNCDVNFKVGENEESIKAHKLILSMRSAVFDRMFNGGFQESEKDPVIPDVTVGAFKALLRYCYYECLDIEDDVALSVLYASTKYMLPLLEEAARKKLIQILNGSNVWDLYKYAINVGDTELYEVSKSYFVGSVRGVRHALSREEFLNIPHRVLLQFLQINDEHNPLDINDQADNDSSDVGVGEEEEGEDEVIDVEEITPKVEAEEDTKNDIQQDNDNTQHMMNKIEVSDCENPDVEVGEEEEEKGADYENNVECRGISISEMELFQACNVWAEAECLRQEIDPTGANKRSVLGECLFLIRFPTILPIDLMTRVYPTGILTQAEVANLGHYIHRESGSVCQVDFPTKERTFVVTSPDVSKAGNKCTVYVESEVQVLLSKVWIMGHGSYRVTVRNKTSEESWSMRYDIQDQGHCTEEIEDKNYILGFIDIRPQVLKPCTIYSVTAEKTGSLIAPLQTHRHKWIVIGEVLPLQEVKIAQPVKNSTGSKDRIYALTLSLV